jgi:predicted alpha/beta-hydrolase family hydrolase
MVRFAKGLAARGVTTLTFDFDYVDRGKKVPDKTDALEARWVAAFAEAKKRFPKTRIAIGGKSMGGRIASHVAASGMVDASCIVFFGYPLHPPGKLESRRDEHLPKIKAPMLFVQGARDAFGGEDEIVPLAQKLRAKVHVVPLGDHSLVVPKRSPVPQEDVYAEALDAAAAFIVAHSKTKPRPAPAPRN